MRARWLAVLVWCARAVAAPAESAPAPTLAAPAPCEQVVLKNTPPLPYNVHEYEAAAVTAARRLAELIEQGAADEARAAILARTVARAPLNPPPAAVALGAPQLHLGVLYITETATLVIFQQNNTVALQQFWRTLASAWNATAVLWANAWLSCEDSGRGWWSGAAAARGMGPVRAAAALFRRLDIVPCEDTLDALLGGAPLCDPDNTLCEASLNMVPEDHVLKYRCRCLPGFWSTMGVGWLDGSALSSMLSCIKCTMGSMAEVCRGPEFRMYLLGVNLGGIIMCIIVGGIIFNKRKSKAVAIGMWTVLEVIVFGAILMYISAALQYLEDPAWKCLLGAWCRELGFVACYGSIVLRLWVLLAEFRTRKAHRWTPRDNEVLRVVAAMIIGAACYLAAFTATAACTGSNCTSLAWHHVTAGAEILLLIAGARIAHAARNARVPFQERRWLATSLVIEALCGMASRGAAAVGVAPEVSPLVATARAHCSAGSALACVMVPRLWHTYRARSLAQEVSKRCPAEGFAEGEEEATSEEVRAELKRLYVQLEILRNTTLRRDNPHISKRRGGRKPVHRRFSLQALQARRGGKGKGGSNSAVEASEGGDASRTPEDSVCSVEGPSHYTDGDTQA